MSIKNCLRRNWKAYAALVASSFLLQGGNPSVNSLEERIDHIEEVAHEKGLDNWSMWDVYQFADLEQGEELRGYHLREVERILRNYEN